MASAERVFAEADDSLAAARAAHLRHVNDDAPGVSRRPAQSGFDYLDPAGNLIGEFATFSRIKALAITPAWTEAWICPVANGPYPGDRPRRAGRKQYRYHNRNAARQPAFDRQTVGDLDEIEAGRG